MKLEQLLFKLELELLRPEIRGSAEALSLLLAEEFLEFGSSGRVFHRSEVIAALQAESPSRYSLSDFDVNVLSTNSALVTYVATREESTAPQVVSLRSSVWVLRSGRWQILFHQGTRVSDD